MYIVNNKMYKKYSRQQYALNKHNPNAKILVSNMNLLSCEIIKNLLLQGHQMVTLHDENKLTQFDVDANIYLTDTNVGANKALIFSQKLAHINERVKLNYTSITLTQEYLDNFDVVIFAGYKPSINFSNYITVKTCGLTGQIFYNLPKYIGEKIVNKCELHDELHALYSSSLLQNLNDFEKNVLTYYDKTDSVLINKFYNSSTYKLCPINSIMSALVTQEVLKVINDIGPFYDEYQYFEALSCLPNNYLKLNKYLFEFNVEKELSNSSCFIVGMGSIGNELLKNLSSMGVNKFIITDPKYITEENTGTSFMFSNSNVKQLKTATAKNYVVKTNRTVDIVQRHNYVNSKTDNIYDKEFYENVTCVFGAVDNAESRTYIDSRCVTFKTNYIDCGSDGFMGHVQTVIPKLTESYNSSRDLLDVSYPLCAIASFPTIIEHCIIWAQELLEEVFNNQIKLLKSYLMSDIKISEDDEKKLLNVFNSIPNTHEDCYKFACDIFKKHYDDNINELLSKFPHDYYLDDGTLFWAAPKKCPHPIKQNELSKNFINMVALMWGKTFHVPNNYNFAKLDTLPKELSMYKKVIIDEQIIDGTIVYCASSLRALNYDIELIDEFTSIGISQKIIPRLVSTNALLAGLASLEFYKIVQKIDTISNYKNSFVNMQLGYLGHAEPISCKKDGYNLWDSFVVNGKDITVKGFLELFETQHKIGVTAIMYESFMFYNLIFNNEKTKSRMDMKIVDIIEGEMKVKLGSTVTLQICDDGDDDLPEVLFML